MSFEEYLSYFEDILQHPENHSLYQDEEYFQYAKMNWKRMGRWLKRFEADSQTRHALSTIDEEQTWIIITEPWCGDAAHSVPVLVKLAQMNERIKIDIQQRDSAPFLIDSYLTNGGKAIPILIIRDAAGADIAVWGPRPAACQQLFNSLKSDHVAFADIKEAIQKWYNLDKGAAIQEEIEALVCKIAVKCH